MSLFRRIFGGSFREARRAEGRGDYREAAAQYVDAELPEDAARCLLLLAARTDDARERVNAFRDALHWLPEEHPQRLEIEGRLGLAILEEVRERGPLAASERRRVEEAAVLLERAERPAEAANAYELLERPDDVARCLQASGDVEKLETLLEASGAESTRRRSLASRLSDHQLSMTVGARREALAALYAATELAPEDPDLRPRLRELEARRPPPGRVRLRVGEREVCFVHGAAMTLGREGDVVVRGASVSREHCRVEFDTARGLRVSDLGSRNGTLVAGVPIASTLTLEGQGELGLGDQVRVRLTPAARHLTLEVLGGLDRGLLAVLGEGGLALPGGDAVLAFVDGWPTLNAATLELDGTRVVAEVELLIGDRLRVDGVLVEVLS